MFNDDCKEFPLRIETIGMRKKTFTTTDKKKISLVKAKIGIIRRKKNM